MKSRNNLNLKSKKPLSAELVRSKEDMPTLPRSSDPRRPSDESILLNPNHPGRVVPDAGSGTSTPADVDQIVSSFLSELDTLSDALEMSRNKSDQERGDPSAPIDLPGQVVLKTASYRNIDVLLMDNAPSAKCRKRPQEEPQSPHAFHGSLLPQRPFDYALRRMAAPGWTRIRSGCLRCWTNFLALTHLDRLR